MPSGINQRAVITKNYAAGKIKQALPRKERDAIACWIENGAKAE